MLCRSLPTVACGETRIITIQEAILYGIWVPLLWTHLRCLISMANKSKSLLVSYIAVKSLCSFLPQGMCNISSVCV